MPVTPADLATPADFDGRVALVTGGGSGIGRATVRLLAARGARVVAADIDHGNAVATVEGLGGDVGRAAAVDVTDPDAVDALMAAVVDAFGGLDLAVNAAGISGAYGAIADQSLDEWRRMIDVNLTGVYIALRAELRQMLSGGERGERSAPGSIVNVSSAAGEMGVPGLAHYSAAKHGVIGLTRSAALENARSGIRVNAVLPGIVRTPMLQRFAGGDEGVDAMAKGSPFGRAAEPEEIAQSIAWLCSDQASFVTGHAFAVDGGALAT
jgi:NAD(P)-dependent dehydrogenase (short-subunit alcohol dehydrogenase family)